MFPTGVLLVPFHNALHNHRQLGRSETVSRSAVRDGFHSIGKKTVLILCPRSYTYAISLSPESLELPAHNLKKSFNSEAAAMES